MSDLFDITDSSDLPFKTVDERKQEALRLRLIEILPEAEGPVSLTQIRAALFRKYEKNYMPNYIINIRITGHILMSSSRQIHKDMLMLQNM